MILNDRSITAMSIKYQYLIFILLIHSLVAGLSYYILIDSKWYFLLSEVGIILSLALSYRIYSNFIKPIELMQTGVDAIKDEDFNVKFLKTGSGDINGLIDVFNQMLEKLRLERVKTQEQSFFLESIIKASPIAMILLDYDERITDINPAALEILSLENADQEMPLSSIDNTIVSEILKIPIGEKELITLDNVTRYRCQVSSVIHKGFNRKFIMIEELSKELLESEKQAYGKVIRMMAHEINNSMGAINSILDTVIEYGLQESEDEEYAEFLTIARKRNEDLARFMKNFANVVRLPDPVMDEVSIGELLLRIKSIMVAQAHDRDIDIKLQLPAKPLVIQCDESQIQQILINAVKNSIESIGTEGSITLVASHHAPHLIVIDDGPGISEEQKSKLFTPFYSSKPTGQGIGLILIRDILMNHGATFQLYTDNLKDETRLEITF